MKQEQQDRLTGEEVLQRIRAELAVPDDGCSPIELDFKQLRERVRQLRWEPIGGRLLPLKRLVFWFVASAFDRQAKVMEELLDLVEEISRENERLHQQVHDLAARASQVNSARSGHDLGPGGGVA